MLDRNTPPPFEVIKSIQFPDTETVLLDNGAPLHIINIGDQPVLRIEIIYEGGAWLENTSGSSFFAIKMLQEGTASRSSTDISEAFDSYGAFVEMTHSADRSGIMLYCLGKFLPHILPILRELVEEASFPEDEWENLRNITIQNIRVNQKKNSWLASTEFKKVLFGGNHPYGKVQTEELVESLQLKDIRQYYTDHILAREFRVVVSGQVTSDAIALLNSFLGQIAITRKSPISYDHQLRAAAPGERRIRVTSDNYLQEAIRMGSLIATRQDPDYFKLLVTNEILGGYFGSRLMKNIREEKGLTYGISSHAVTMKQSGFFMIGADVKQGASAETIEEIHKEIRRLQVEPVPSHELETVKNFMAGEFAGSLTTAFEVADRQKILLLDNLSRDFYSNYIEQIHATQPEDILKIAKKSLIIEEFIEIIA